MLISMSRSLKLRVIAEGVETAEQLAFLQAHDCDEAQGYFFSRPVPPEQFGGLLRTGLWAGGAPFVTSGVTAVSGTRGHVPENRRRTQRALSP